MDIFLGGGHPNLVYFISIHFRVFSEGQGTELGDIFWGC